MENMEKVVSLKNIIKSPLTICFSVSILFILILGFLLPDKELSEWENRYLTKRPGLSATELLDGSFMIKYEDYINDQMPFRDQFIKLKAISETVLLKIENNGIARGKSSYLFTKNTGDAATFDKNIAIIGEFISRCNNDVTVVVAPNACEVLGDYVPVGLPNVNQEQKLAELYEDNSLLKGARVVDLSSVLKAHGDEYIYYRTDHHWTTDGAYYAYREISDNPVNIRGISKSCSEQFLGTLYAKYKGLNVEPDYITYYDIPVKSYVTDEIERDGIYDISKLDVFDKYGMFMWGNFGRCDLVSNIENGKKAIIFKDSYANCLIPFMTYDYENITIIDLRYYKDSVSDFMLENEDSDVFFINNFDFLNEDNHFYKLLK